MERLRAAAFEGTDNLNYARRKDVAVYELMAADPYATVLDIRCNYGLHSEMCASLGKRVVAVDVEESCLNELFLRTQKSKKNILVSYLDFLWPIGETGIMNTIPSVHERLACDTILSMALVHHLVFKNDLGFESIARNLSRFARCRAIVEFVPADDIHVSRWNPERKPWYSIANFVSAMLEHFVEFKLLPSDPAPRKILVFEGKKNQRGY